MRALRLAAGVILAIAMSVGASPARAATCAGLTPAEALDSAHAVVFGEVAAVRSADLRSGGEIDLRVERAFKGTDAGRTLTMAIAADGPGTVGYWIVEPGTWHTLYLRQRQDWPTWPDQAPNATLYTSFCFGTHDGPPTREELLVFGETSEIRVPGRHESGIAILRPTDPRDLTPVDEPLAAAWSDARQLAEQNPEVLGPPWIDRAAGQLVVSAVDGRGQTVLWSWMEVGSARAGTKPAPPLAAPQVPVRMREVQRSMGELLRIQDELSRPQPAGYSGDARIWSVWIDEQHARVAFETDRLNPDLLAAIVQTYGADAVAVRVDQRSGPISMELEPASGNESAPSTSALPWTAALGGIAALIAALLIARLRRSIR